MPSTYSSSPTMAVRLNEYISKVADNLAGQTSNLAARTSFRVGAVVAIGTVTVLEKFGMIISWILGVAGIKWAAGDTAFFLALSILSMLAGLYIVMLLK